MKKKFFDSREFMQVYGVSFLYEIGMISLGCSCIQSYALDLPGHDCVHVHLITDHGEGR